MDYFGRGHALAGILVWGANPAVSGADGELQWLIKDAVTGRARPMVVVDPQPTELARQAACWLRLRPGTDGALALGILNLLISRRTSMTTISWSDYTYGFDGAEEALRRV